MPPLLTAFDFPDVDSSCEERFKTTQPGQALAMINGEFLNEQASKLAARVATEAGRSCVLKWLKRFGWPSSDRQQTKKSPTDWNY